MMLLNRITPAEFIKPINVLKCLLCAKQRFRCWGNSRLEEIKSLPTWSLHSTRRERQEQTCLYIR